MPNEKHVRITEAYNPKTLTQAVNQIVERGYNGLPLAQAVSQLTQSPPTNSTPSEVSNSSPNPSPPTGPTSANDAGGKS